MMKLLFLGTGSAMTIGTENYHSNMVFLSEKGEKLLIDCGSDIRFSLHKQHMDYRDISHIYISHLHADHAGGLEWLALSRKFDRHSPNKPTLFIAEPLAESLWTHTLSGGLATLQNEIATLDTYFDVHRVPLNGAFEWQGAHFQLFQTIHVMNGYALMPSFGLICKILEQTILITTDTQFFPHQMTGLYSKADVIFHDCETSQTPSGVHAHFKDLCKLPAHIKAKMWLYHYNPGPLPDAKAQGFKGFVDCGQVFDFR